MPAFFLTPVMTTGGAFYHPHENCFLSPLILWLFYALISSGVEIHSICLIDSICERGRGTLRSGIRTLFCFPKTFHLSTTFKKWLYAGTLLCQSSLHFSLKSLSLALLLAGHFTHGMSHGSRYAHHVGREQGLPMKENILPTHSRQHIGSLFTGKKWDIS